MRRSHANAILVAVALIWGLAFVPQSWGMADLGPLAFTGLRFGLGALVVWPLAWRERSRAPQQGRHALGAMLGLGGLMFAGVTMQQVGLVTTTVTNAGFLTALYVPLVPLVSWGLLGLRPHPVVWPAAALCVLGTWLLAGGHQLNLAVGDWWVLASAVPWALHVALVGVVADKWHAPYRVACIQFAVCSVLGLAAAWWWEPLSWARIGQAAGALAYTGLVSVGVGFTAQVVAQRHTHAADAALILSSEMVFAALFGAWLMGDRLSPSGWAGCTLILLAIVAAQWVPLVWRRPHEAQRS